MRKRNEGCSITKILLWDKSKLVWIETGKIWNWNAMEGTSPTLSGLIMKTHSQNTWTSQETFKKCSTTAKYPVMSTVLKRSDPLRTVALHVKANGWIEVTLSIAPIIHFSTITWSSIKLKFSRNQNQFLILSIIQLRTHEF